MLIVKQRPLTLARSTAAYSILSRDPSAKCNGVRPECYKNLCAEAQRSCPPAATGNKPLKLARCPSKLSSQFTEVR